MPGLAFCGCGWVTRIRVGEATGDSALDTEDSRTESALDTLVLPSPESARVAGLESEPKLRRVTDLSLVPELEGAGGAGCLWRCGL